MDEKEQIHEEPLLWSRSQAAVQLGISDRKVDELIKEGVYWCQDRQFWTGLRPKHDIIQGAQGWWCVIRKENANA